MAFRVPLSRGKSMKEACRALSVPADCVVSSGKLVGGGVVKPVSKRVVRGLIGRVSWWDVGTG